ncbi:hypothetical protein BpHYR1_020981 [Brachionus plicatilis]|uniref:Uncharacterized protein n=1 Tax=Brachionus plicatilis TaxID=10195 RepID=A0A3M7T1K9_BRAPC|nr:hypothetical protein BpHYR1_020981 [Brachionus plicatilis]
MLLGLDLKLCQITEINKQTSINFKILLILSSDNNSALKRLYNYIKKAEHSGRNHRTNLNILDLVANIILHFVLSGKVAFLSSAPKCIAKSSLFFLPEHIGTKAKHRTKTAKLSLFILSTLNLFTRAKLYPSYIGNVHERFACAKI